jgi:hypothetical protein
MAEINEAKREEIRKGAKKILDGFAKTLEGVKLSGKLQTEGIGGFRVEGEGKKGDSEFRRAMFNNAPNKNDDNIFAEKKKW